MSTPRCWRAFSIEEERERLRPKCSMPRTVSAQTTTVWTSDGELQCCAYPNCVYLTEVGVDITGHWLRAHGGASPPARPRKVPGCTSVPPTVQAARQHRHRHHRNAPRSKPPPPLPTPQPPRPRRRAVPPKEWHELALNVTQRLVEQEAERSRHRSVYVSAAPSTFALCVDKHRTRPYSCGVPGCAYRSARIGWVTRHRVLEHPAVTPLNENYRDGVPAFQCMHALCGFTSENETALRVHYEHTHASLLCG